MRSLLPGTVLTLLIALCAGIPAVAQEQGGGTQGGTGQGPATGGTPELEVPPVIVVEGTRTVVLPPARKGEVFDTTLYVLPPGDTLIFGDRITNLHGDGGLLPQYGEFDNPLKFNAEASIGTYISPHGRLSMEYSRDRWNVRGLLDAGSTAGHVDGAEAGALLIDGNIEYQIQGQLPSPGKARVSGGLTYAADGYTLYGNEINPFDRSRDIIDVDLGITSETDAVFDYAIGMSIESVSITDDTVAFTGDASAVTPGFSARFRLGDDKLNLGAGVEYQSTSLDYQSVTDNPEFVEGSGQVEWSPSPGLFITAGAVLGYGSFSDSGSSSLIMPKGAIRYDMNKTFALFARFAPELRAPSYRSRIMEAPYVNRDIALRPEKVTFHLAGGTRINLGAISVHGELFVESASNTPVVTLDSIPGALRYAHVDSRTLGIRGGVDADLADNLKVVGELSLLNSVDDETDEQLPMRPNLEITADLHYALTKKFGISGSLTFRNEQRIALEESPIPVGVESTIENQLLLGGGATYQLLEPLALFAEVTNLLNQGYDWWQNYQAPGIELRVGARARF